MPGHKCKPCWVKPFKTIDDVKKWETIVPATGDRLPNVRFWLKADIRLTPDKVK